MPRMMRPKRFTDHVCRAVLGVVHDGAVVGDGQATAGRDQPPTPRPNRLICWPVEQGEGKGPASNAGEGVEGAALHFFRRDFFDTPLIDRSLLDVAGADQVAEPLCCVGIVFVVKGQLAASRRGWRGIAGY